MSINKETVRHIAELARIELDADEVDYYAGQLKKILGYIEKINQLDLKKVTPVLSVHADSNIYRKDEIAEFENKPGLLKIAPKKEGEYIKVPKVIEE